MTTATVFTRVFFYAAAAAALAGAAAPRHVATLSGHDQTAHRLAESNELARADGRLKA
jgi:hypothetical protein